MGLRPVLLVAGLIAACNEYDLKPDAGPSEDEEEAPAGPEIEVDPTSLDLGILCGAETREVTITNIGSAMLELYALSVTGEGWALLDDTSRPGLPAGESLVLSLVGTGGDAILSISSNDADEGLVEVPLAAQADEAPGVSITSPSSGQTLDIGAVTTFSGLVYDDADAAETLAISWTSDVDGTLGSDPAAADGTVSLAWDAAVRTAGLHTITLTATDTCGQSASASVAVCQQAGYTSDELDIGSWHVEGESTWDETNGWVQITSPTTYSTGSAFAIDETVSGEAVTIEYLFYIGGGTGADGFTLTALDAEQMTTWLGSPGCGLGYAGESASVCVSPTTAGFPGWSVEVDTYYNSGVDPTDADHVSFTFDGNLLSYQAWAALPEVEDNGWHTMAVSVVAPHVTVAIDGITYIDQDIAGDYDFPAYVGFSAATGADTNYHLIKSLEVTDFACE